MSSEGTVWSGAEAVPPTSLALWTAEDLVAGFAAGDFTPVDAARAALAQIDAHDGAVNAVVLRDEDTALEMAARSAARWQSGEQLGPVDGVPMTLKDILLTREWPTLRGSNLIDEAGPWGVDAPAVARLREAGAVFLGKNTTPEFAWKGVTDSLRHGATGNPWGAGLTGGGSSGGAATAVGLGMGTWSVGTDGGGSVRIPASFTGTVASNRPSAASRSIHRAPTAPSPTPGRWPAPCGTLRCCSTPSPDPTHGTGPRSTG